MPTNLGVSEVIDKHGVTADIEAKRFDGTRTVQIQGDVTASQTWNGDSSSPLTLNASIGAKKVTQDKIGDKAVGTGQMDDGSVGLTQMDPNAMNGTVQDNDSKLATHSAVKTYVDSQISGQGTYLGKHTVAEINAFVTDNLHNGDRVMVSDSGTINLGPGGVGFDVIAGEDLILYKSGSTVQWDTMDGNFKTKQNAVSKAGSTTKTVTAFSQNENGDADVTYEEIQRASTSHEGLVQLTDSHASTSTTTAATPNSVKSAYDLANTANTGAVKNVAYDSTNKKITKTINGTTTDVVSAATLKTDMALNNVDNTSDANKPVSTAQQAALELKLDKTGDGKDVTVSFSEASARANIGTGEKLSVMFGKIKKWFTDLKALAFKDTVSDSDISGTISDNHIASASTWNGKADKVSGATNGNIAALDSNGNLTDSGKKASDFELVNNKVNAWQVTPDDTHFPSEKLVKDGLGAKADANKVVAIADAYVNRGNISTVGWYKLADRPFTYQVTNNNSLFDLVANIFENKYYGRLKVCVRSESSGSYPVFKNIAFYSEFGWPKDLFPIKFVSRGLVGACTLEVWVGLTDKYRGVSLTEVGTSGAGGYSAKEWNYYKISTGAGESEPADDETNHVKTVDVVVHQDQHNIVNPKNDNLVAMDASGIVKDSGVAVLPSTSTWDGTSDAKVPTAKAVQAKLDGKQDSLTFMNDSEAVAIWADAKTAAANAS